MPRYYHLFLHISVVFSIDAFAVCCWSALLLGVCTKTNGIYDGQRSLFRLKKNRSLADPALPKIDSFSCDSLGRYLTDKDQVDVMWRLNVKVTSKSPFTVEQLP